MSKDKRGTDGLRAVLWYRDVAVGSALLEDEIELYTKLNE